MTGGPGTSARTDAPAPTKGTLATALGASSVEETTLLLPSTRRAVSVPAYLRVEATWTDPLPREFGAVPNKPAYVLDGAPLYPELLVVRLLERAGWGAAWRKTWNGDAYWRDLGEKVEPGPLALTIVDQVSRQAGYAGPWDIIAWRGRGLRFLCSRTAAGQRVSAFMADWLDTALRMGIPVSCFAIVEHQTTVRRVPRRRF